MCEVYAVSVNYNKLHYTAPAPAPSPSVPTCFNHFPPPCALFYLPPATWLQTPSPRPSYGSYGPTYLGLLYYMDPWVLNVSYFLSLMADVVSAWGWRCFAALAEQYWAVLVKLELVQVQIGSGQVMKSGPLSYLTIKRSHFLIGHHILLWGCSTNTYVIHWLIESPIFFLQIFKTPWIPNHKS